MMTAKKLTGLALATAAAGLFATAGMAPVMADEKAEAKMHCDGVNSCKGQTACQTASNACKGQNSCKGKGWMYMTKAECDAAKTKMKDVEKK
jgi:hypothetical protein